MANLTPPAYHIIHQTQGRVRLGVPWLGQHPDQAKKLQGILENTDYITHVRINRTARSLIIHYQPGYSIAAQLSHLLSKCLSDQATSSPTHPPTLTSKLQDSEEGEWSSLQLPVTAALLAFLCRFPRFAILRPLAVLTLLAAAFPVAQRAFHSLIGQHRLNIDCLDLLALSLSGWQGKLLTPAMVIALHEFGDVIREQTARSTEVRTTNLMDAIGRFAWVKYGDHAPQPALSYCKRLRCMIRAWLTMPKKSPIA
jgi:Cu2+-exporting ATPase